MRQQEVSGAAAVIVSIQLTYPKGGYKNTYTAEPCGTSGECEFVGVRGCRPGYA